MHCLVYYLNLKKIKYLIEVLLQCRQFINNFFFEKGKKNNCNKTTDFTSCVYEGVYFQGSFFKKCQQMPANVLH